MRLTTWTALMLLASALAFPFGWLLSSDLAPLYAAQLFLREDQRVRHAVGAVEKVSLQPLGSELRWRGTPTSPVGLNLVVWGPKATARAYVQLSYESAWKVTTATLTVEQRHTLQLR